MINSNAFNNLTLVRFNEQLYRDVITDSEIYGNERVLEDKQTKGFTAKKGKKVYFIPSIFIYREIENEVGIPERKYLLPIKIRKERAIVDKSDVFYLVVKADSVVSGGEDTMSFRELVDTFCPFKHSNSTHFNLYKIMCICAYVNKTHWRVATKVAFGKNSIVDVLRDLTNDCARIDKATPAKLDFSLQFPFILINEIANLKKEEKDVFIQFAISVGDRSNKYTKPTRKSEGTKEIYDISKLSVCFTYNVAEYFRDRGDESFDDYFKENVLDRYIPFKLEGWLDVEQFKRSGEIDFDKEALNYRDLYIRLLKKFTHLKGKPLVNPYPLNPKYDFGHKYRWKNDFMIICDYIGNYAKDIEEFNMLTDELYTAHKRYLREELMQPENQESGIYAPKIEVETI